MAARHRIAAWLRDRRGAMAVEFALIAPLLLLVTVAIFETVFLLSDMHTAGEATRRGARIAIIEDPIVSLKTVANSTVICTGDGTNSVKCSPGTVIAATTFTDILAAMQQIAPWLTAPNVRVTYAKSGIDTDSKLLTPLITVEITGATYQPKTTSAFDLNLAVPLGGFETSQMGTTVVVN